MGFQPMIHGQDARATKYGRRPFFSCGLPRKVRSFDPGSTCTHILHLSILAEVPLLFNNVAAIGANGQAGEIITTGGRPSPSNRSSISVVLEARYGSAGPAMLFEFLDGEIVQRIEKSG